MTTATHPASMCEEEAAAVAGAVVRALTEPRTDASGITIDRRELPPIPMPDRT